MPTSTEIYTYLHTLSLHAALPILRSSASCGPRGRRGSRHRLHVHGLPTPSRHYTRSRRQSHVRAPQPSPSRIASSCGSGFSHKLRSEEHTSELQSLMRISYAVFCLKKKKTK